MKPADTRIGRLPDAYSNSASLQRLEAKQRRLYEAQNAGYRNAADALGLASYTAAANAAAAYNVGMPGGVAFDASLLQNARRALGPFPVDLRGPMTDEVVTALRERTAERQRHALAELKASGRSLLSKPTTRRTEEKS